MSPLLRHDLLIVRSTMREAMARKRDWVPLLAIPPLLVAGLVQAVGRTPGSGLVPIDLALVAAGLVGLSVGVAVERRLDWLRTESVAARFALQRRDAFAYAAFWHAPALLLTVVGVVLLAGSWLGAAPYVAGAVLASAGSTVRLSMIAGLFGPGRGRARSRAELAGGSVKARIRALLVLRAGFSSRGVGTNLVLFALLGAAAGLPYPLIGGAGGAVASGVALIGLLAWLMRQHPALWRYWLYLGHGPVPAALAPLALVAAVLLGFGVSLGLAGAASWAALAGGLVVILALCGLLIMLRALHYATKSRATADMAFQIDLAALALAGWLAWPLVPVLIAVRLVQLQKRVRTMRYLRT